MTIRVCDLTPGDIFNTGLPAEYGPETACFVAQTQHPLWPNLQLVIWRMSDGSWSHDALDAQQVLNGVFVRHGGSAAVREALLGGTTP